MNSKTYLGTGAAMTLGLGAVPKTISIRNLTTGLFITEWDEGMLANTAVAGGIIHNNASTMVLTPQTGAQGIQRYFGGDVVVTASNNVVVDPTIRHDLVSNLQGAATLFTMDTAANGTGHFNGALASGAGKGSFIQLAYRDTAGNMAQWTGRIADLSASGLTSDQVTLNPSAPNIGVANLINMAGGARIVYVGPLYDLIQAPAGLIMPAGVKLLNTTYMTSAVHYEISWS